MVEAAEVSAEVSAEVVTEARRMGWVPAEEFKGDKTKWVDADAYVENGRKILPIVKRENEALRADLTALRTQVERQNQTIAANQDAMAALEEFHSAETKRKVKEVREKLLSDLKAAKDADDTEAEVRITDALTQNAQALKEAGEPAKKKETQPPADHTKEPGFVAWVSENPWFGTDETRTELALFTATRLRQKGVTSVGRPFFDKVSEEMEKLVPGKAAPAEDKVNGGGRPSNARGGGKTFSDLPADAKAACDKYETRLVGEGRKFANQTDYRKYYVAKYFEGDE